MATLGLIGSGNIGGTLGRLAVDAGLDVALSNSRRPETLSELAPCFSSSAGLAHGSVRCSWTWPTWPTSPGAAPAVNANGYRRAYGD